MKSRNHRLFLYLTKSIVVIHHAHNEYTLKDPNHCHLDPISLSSWVVPYDRTSSTVPRTWFYLAGTRCTTRTYKLRNDPITINKYQKEKLGVGGQQQPTNQPTNQPTTKNQMKRFAYCGRLLN